MKSPSRETTPIKRIVAVILLGLSIVSGGQAVACALARATLPLAR